MNDPLDPIARFVELFEKAKASEPHDATAMALATADARGRPSVRMVLLKGADARGFVFFTNFGSRKGRELEQNPFAALTIHWPAAKQQVRVEGRVEHVSDEESDAYFASRPRQSQAPALGRLSRRPRPHRALVRAPGAAPRPLPLRAHCQRLDRDAAQPLTVIPRCSSRSFTRPAPRGRRRGP
jgi:pyridoxamine 5'-phosphate oxidase